MKEKIIGFVMNTIHLRWLPNWTEEDAKNFCKLILDGEGIEYEEEEIHFIPSVNEDTKTIEIVKRYAQMYRDVYSSSDAKKAAIMNEIFVRCNSTLDFSRSLDGIFSDNFKAEPEQKITIKPGESIQFSNRASSSLRKEDFANLLKATFPEEQQKEEEPFTISFHSNVSEEVKEEVLRRITGIYEEVCSEMGVGKGR